MVGNRDEAVLRLTHAVLPFRCSAIDRISQLMESDLEGLWIRVNQDMQSFQEYCGRLAESVGRELTEQGGLQPPAARSPSNVEMQTMI